MKSIKMLPGFALGVVVSAVVFGSSEAFAVDTPYSIIYDSGVVTDMPTDEDSKTLNDTVQISSSKPKRNGLSFYGWCNTIPTKVDGNDTCSGTTFAIGSDWSINPTTVNNNLRLYAMWGEERPEPQPATAGCINYFANASDAVGTMGCQSKSSEDGSSYHTIADGGSATLLASNFSRTGYGFAGWSDSFDYATNPNAHFYGPHETITIPTGTTANGLSLYAVWVKSQGSIQDQSKVASVCSSLTTAPTDGTANLTSVSALTDQRDNNTYAIAKLADGNCWMIENLRLESTAEHNSDGTLAQGYGTSATYGNFGGLADAESANFEEWLADAETTTANSLYYSGTQEGTASIDIDTTNYPSFRMPRYNNLNTSTRASNPTSNYFPDDNTTGGMYSYGNYYTWPAAMANTSFYSSPTATDADGKTSETVNTSLCPTGWRLPYGNDTGNGTIAGGFYNLNYKINNDSNVTDSTASLKLRSFPNNFLYSGDFYASSPYSRGLDGYYWSSTAGDYNNSYNLVLYSSDVYPGTGLSDKFGGQSIRCTAGS